MKGRYYEDKWTPEGWNKAIQFFRQAVEKDRSYASAYAGIAESYAMLGNFAYLSANEAFPNAMAAAKRAIDLDDSVAEAHAAMGLASLMTWDWVNADQELRRAIELNSNLSEVHVYRSWYLAAFGKLADAVNEGRLAEELDPLSITVNTSLDSLYDFQHNYDKALEQCQKALEISPSAATVHYDLYEIYAAKSMYDKAVEELEQGLKFEGKPQEAVAIEQSYKLEGYKGMLRKRIEIGKNDSLEDYEPSVVAESYLRLGDKDQAFVWLNKAYEARSEILFVKVDPRLDAIRSDPRYADLLRRMGLPQ